MPAAVQISALTKRFGSVTAVDDLDLHVRPGRLLALLGPSGCGKTTLLRLIAGFEVPDTGTITVDGRPVAGARKFVPPEHRGVGMVFQDYALFPHLDVAANVGFGLTTRGTARQGKITDILGLVGLAGLGARMPHELSGGQQQRVALARALAPDPAVVLLDEPFSNLDTGLRARVRSEVRMILRMADATAVLVTHDQAEALSIADDVAVMDRGRITQCADPEEVYRRPAGVDVARFLGDAVLLRGHGRGYLAETDLGMLELAEPGEGALDLLVRPEDVVVTSDAAGVAEVVTREFYGRDQIIGVELASGLRLRAWRSGHDGSLHIGERCAVSIRRPLVAYPVGPAHADESVRQP